MPSEQRSDSLHAQAIIFGSRWKYTCYKDPGQASTATLKLNDWLIVYGAVLLALSLIYSIFKAVSMLFYHCFVTTYTGNRFSNGPFDCACTETSIFLGLWGALIMSIVLTIWSMAWLGVGGKLIFGVQGELCKFSVLKAGQSLYLSAIALWICLLLSMPMILAMVMEAVLVLELIPGTKVKGYDLL